MLKKAHKIIYIACFTIVFSLFSIASAETNFEAVQKMSMGQMNLVQSDVKVNDLDIEPINTQSVKKNVVPDTHKEGKKVLAYFLKVMLLVSFSLIVVYLILVFVKNYRSAFVNFQEEDDFEAFDLTTPSTRQDALKSFLNRTK